MPTTPVADRLFFTARTVLDHGHDVLPMVVAVKRDQELASVLVRADQVAQVGEPKHQALWEALVIPRLLEAEEIYILADAFVSHRATLEAAAEAPAPSEDPAAQEALVVERLDAAGASLAHWVWYYRRGDGGEIEFETAEPLQSDEVLGNLGVVGVLVAESAAQPLPEEVTGAGDTDILRAEYLVAAAHALEARGHQVLIAREILELAGVVGAGDQPEQGERGEGGDGGGDDEAQQ